MEKQQQYVSSQHKNWKLDQQKRFIQNKKRMYKIEEMQTLCSLSWRFLTNQIENNKKLQQGVFQKKKIQQKKKGRKSKVNIQPNIIETKATAK